MHEILEVEHRLRLACGGSLHAHTLHHSLPTIPHSGAFAQLYSSTRARSPGHRALPLHKCEGNRPRTKPRRTGYSGTRVSRTVTPALPALSVCPVKWHKYSPASSL